MTTAQEKKLYWPLWQDACRACAWRVQKGRLELREPAGDAEACVQGAATAIADQAHRAVTLDDLRRGCHVVATGRNCSHSVLTNKEVTRLKWLFLLLKDPLDLNALRHWLNPGLDQREMNEAAVAAVPEGYVISICEDRFGTKNWRGLGDEDLAELTRMLAVRGQQFRRAGTGSGSGYKAFRTREEVAA